MKYTYDSSPKTPLRQRLIAAAGAILLSVTSICGAVTVNAAEPTVPTPTDLSTNTVFDAPKTAMLSPAALLSYAIGQPLTSEERLWLETEAGDLLPAELALAYDCTVPHEEIEITYPAEGGITVTVKPYRGETLDTLWTPVSVTLDGEEYPLSTTSENSYTADIMVSGDYPISVTVTYDASLTPSSEAMESLLNAAYRRGRDILSAYEAYEKALTQHTEATQAYNTYRAALQQYRSELALYNAYLAAQKDYETRQKAYEDYLAELADYEERLAAYHHYLSEKAAYDEAYAEYMAFVTDPSSYEKKYLAYCEYLADMTQVRAQLAILESCFVSDSVGHVLNNTLNGPTVSTVVQNQNELVSAGCDAKDIANADAATARLIALLADYPQEAEEAQRYAYYIRHYAAIRDNVTLLYTSLSRLYGNDLVPEILDMQGKKERYWQFVAQLYALSCAMEDEVAFDIQWRISDGKLTDLLEDCFILKDTNGAAPLASYPAPVEEVTSPAEIKKPTPPAVVEQPVAPLKVAEPTPPQAVAKPVPPAVVPAPGQRPTAPIFSACEVSLAGAVRIQALTERHPLVDTVTYPLSLSVDKSAAPEDMVTAAFYLDDRMTLWAVVIADENGLVVFPEKAPTRPSEQGITYTFSGWMDDRGHAYPATDEAITVDENTHFYAVYTTAKERYTVTWDVDGHTTTESYFFGEIPDFKGTPTKAEDATCVYSFAGWSPAITPVNGAVTYTAIFTPHDKIYKVQWVIGDTSETDEYLSGELPTYPATPVLPMDGRYMYVFRGWSPEITTVTGNAVYTAVFEAVDLLGGREDAVMTEENGQIMVTVKGEDAPWRMDIAHIAAYAVSQNRSLTFRYQGFELSFGSEAIETVSRSNATYLMLTGTAEDGSPLSLNFYDASDALVSLDVEARLRVEVAEGQSGFIFDRDGQIVSAFSEGRVSATLKSGIPYALTRGYEIQSTITVDEVADDEGGLCLLPDKLAPAGKKVTFEVTAAPGFGVKYVIVRDKFGGVIASSTEADGTYSFVMPEGGAHVSVDFTPHMYTVTFRMGDRVLASDNYRYGETPRLPSDPVKANDDTHSYAFTGWSPTVTIVVGDAVYEAQFMAVPLGGQASVDDSGIGFAELLWIGLGAFILSCAGILVPYVIAGKKKRTKVEEIETKEREAEREI